MARCYGNLFIGREEGGILLGCFFVLGNSQEKVDGAREDITLSPFHCTRLHACGSASAVVTYSAKKDTASFHSNFKSESHHL